jgi:hypothetical protein
VAANADSFNCERCPWGRHCDDSNPAPFAKWVIKGVIESRTCLLPMVTQQSTFLLRMHSHYRGRILPYDGGILDQPNYYIEMMEAISAHEARMQAEEAERTKRRGDKNHGLRSMVEG